MRMRPTKASHQGTQGHHPSDQDILSNVCMCICMYVCAYAYLAPLINQHVRREDVIERKIEIKKYWVMISSEHVISYCELKVPG